VKSFQVLWFYPEDGGTKLFHNIDTFLHCTMVLCISLLKMAVDTYDTMNFVTLTAYPVSLFALGLRYQLVFTCLGTMVWAITPVGFGKPL